MGVLAAALAGAAPAQAAERGLVLGAQVFGAPACGTPVVERATFTDPAVLAGADTQRCRILLNRSWVEEMPRAMRCTLVLHEYGHLAGRPHSDDPDSVMYADYLRADERCRAVTAEALSRGRRAAGTSGSARSSP